MSDNSRALSQLKGATMAITGLDPHSRLAVLFALQQCVEHSGTHHFGVVSEGEIIICSPDGIACLRAQGVQL